MSTGNFYNSYNEKCSKIHSMYQIHQFFEERRISMSLITTEKQFESDIAAALLSLPGATPATWIATTPSWGCLWIP